MKMNKNEIINELKAIINVIDLNKESIEPNFKDRLIMEINHSIKIIERGFVNEENKTN